MIFTRKSMFLGFLMIFEKMHIFEKPIFRIFYNEPRNGTLEPIISPKTQK